MKYSEEEALYFERQRYQELRLERRRFAYEYAVSDHIREERGSGLLKYIDKETRVRLSCDIWCHDEQAIVKFEPVSYPATWWEHLKQRWFPRWALRRWPVRLTTVERPPVTVRACAMFPNVSRRDDPRDYLYVRFVITDPEVRP